MAIIAAAAPPAPPPSGFDFSKLSPNWFDVLAIVLMGFGVFQGKKRGMSQELLPVFQWLLIVVVGSLYYSPLAQLLSQVAGMGRLGANVLCYIAIAVVIKIAFSVIKKMVGEKLVGSDIFGRMEFYFGMVAGMLRWFCVVMVILAITNSKVVNQEEIAAAKKKQTAELGSTFFPPLEQIRQDMLYNSVIGHAIREHLADQLISPSVSTGTATAPVNREQGVGRKREKALDDAVNGTTKDAPKEKK